MSALAVLADIGIHPYADAWPLLGDEELSDLAADIGANGLREPVVLLAGKILDGRNRYAACRRVDVEPTFVKFDGDDDAALAFVQSVNNGRRHQSKGSLAASWALSMLAAGKRSDGRWEYGAGAKGPNPDLSKARRAELGVIADWAPDLLVQVRDDELTLNAAHRQAESARDEERKRLEREERIAAEEAEAKAFIEENAPDLAAQVGDVFRTYAEALAVWEKRNREEAERIAAEKAAEAERAAWVQRNAEQMSENVATAVMCLHALTADNAFERFVTEEWPAGSQAASPALRDRMTPEHLREIAQALERLADQWDQEAAA